MKSRSVSIINKRPGSVIVDYGEVRRAVIYRPFNRARPHKRGGEKKMRNKILILIPIMLLVLALVGCIPGITPAPEPEEPVSEMEAVALAELLEVEDDWTIVWSIVNTGDVFIREYTLIFKVDYPDISKDYLTIKLTKTYLEVGAIHSGDITLAPYGDPIAIPESVSVRWELSK